MKFQVVSDSSCDLGRERAEKLGVTLVSYYVSMDGKNYYREERDITAQEFYRQMAEHPGVFPRTSMPTIEDYLDAFRPIAARGEAVLCICLNEPFSGAIQCARNAREVLLEEFPQAQVRVLDSQLATVLQGLLVIEAVRLRDAGCSLEEAAGILERTKTTGRIFFTINDLEYLRHGGRIGKAAAATGSLLRVKPLIGYEGDGLVTDGIAPGRKNSLNRVMELFYRYLTRREIDLNDYYLATGYGLEQEEYQDFTRRLLAGLEERGYPARLVGEFHIGVTIGVHTGPTPIGVGILKKEAAFPGGAPATEN